MEIATMTCNYDTYVWQRVWSVFLLSQWHRGLLEDEPVPEWQYPCIAKYIYGGCYGCIHGNKWWGDQWLSAMSCWLICLLSWLLALVLLLLLLPYMERLQQRWVWWHAPMPVSQGSPSGFAREVITFYFRRWFWEMSSIFIMVISITLFNRGHSEGCILTQSNNSFVNEVCIKYIICSNLHLKDVS